MATAEDIFYLYERNSTHYSNCSKNGKKDVCPTYNFDECFSTSVSQLHTLIEI